MSSTNEHKTEELVGILQATSIVAQSLAKRLIRLEDEVKRKEEDVYRVSEIDKH